MKNVAILEKDAQNRLCYEAVMLKNWLQNALSESDISQSELSRQLTSKLGKSVDRAAVNKMLSGSRVISGEELKAIEAITRHAVPSSIHIPLKGHVGAGQIVEPFDDDGDLEYIQAPTGAVFGTVAVLVRGDSMYPAYDDGTILFYSKHLPPENLTNKRAIVKLSDGRIFVKIIRVGSSPNLWVLQSLNTQTADISDIEIEWASPIDWVKP